MESKQCMKSLTVETKHCSFDESSQPALISPLSEENASPIVQSPSSIINNNHNLNSDTSMRDKCLNKAQTPTKIEELSSPNGSTRRQALHNQQNILNKQSPQNQSCTKTTDSTNCEPRSSFHPVTMTLNFLDTLGVFVESIVSTACGHLFNDFDDDDNTINTYEREQLLDGIEKFERMNSFDTFGTMNTMGTINTFATVETNDTASTMGTNTVASCTVDDDGNVIPADVIKDHLIRKQIADKLNESSAAQESEISSPSSLFQSDTNNTEKSSQPKKKKKKRRLKKKRSKKVVGFEYPPISKVRQVPRVTSTERKNLFFNEDEIECDSNSESDYESSEDEMQIAITPKISTSATGNKNIKISSALRKGKYASNIQKSPTRAPVIVHDHIEQQPIIEDKSAGGLNRFCGRRSRRNKSSDLAIDDVSPTWTLSSCSNSD